MVKKPKGITFAQLLKQPTWNEVEAGTSREHAVRPGRYNATGELFDPSGRLMLLQHDHVTPELRLDVVADEILVDHLVIARPMNARRNFRRAAVPDVLRSPGTGPGDPR